MTKKMKYAMLILLLLFTGLAAEEYEQKIQRSFQLPANGAIELASINGEIDITTTGGAAIDIRAVKKSNRKGEIDKVEITFERVGDILKVKTKYNERHARAKVDFTVSIPEKLARAEFKSVNGTLDCTGKYADLTLKTVNGQIDFAGEFRSGTFQTVNGAIEVSQETLLGGDLVVETVNGAIDNEFGVRVEKHLVGSSFGGTVNGGGRKVKVETVNGSIDISKI